MPFKVDDVSRSFFNALFKKTRKKVTIDDLIIFTDQMSAMYRAGFTLSSSMAFLEEQTGSEELKNALFALSLRLERGSSLSKALQEYPEIFPEYYVKNISAAEMAGVLQETLSKLSAYLKSDKRLRQQIKKTYLYPKIVFFTVLLSSVFLAFWQGMIVPGRNLLLSAAIISLCVVLIYDFLKEYFGKGAGRRTWDDARMKVVFFGPLYTKMLNKQFAEMFIPLYRSGIPISDVFRLIGDAIENTVYGESIRAIGRELERGEKVSGAVGENPFFPFELKTLFRVDEITGEFDKNLEFIINQMEHELALSLKTAMYAVYIVYMAVLSGLILWMRGMFT